MALCTAAHVALYLNRDHQQDRNLAPAFTVESVAYLCLVPVSFPLEVSFHLYKQVLFECWYFYVTSR